MATSRTLSRRQVWATTISTSTSIQRVGDPTTTEEQLTVRPIDQNRVRTRHQERPRRKRLHLRVGIRERREGRRFVQLRRLHKQHLHAVDLFGHGKRQHSVVLRSL
ncbi:hypothetical protein L596_008500 [Steinernema carpocapsae]|uniref:Uncharacterized protein n=1 Tax=Steinernema carpocapsae TaxID=34508 RepID=A0A4U5PD72_STECR|nr:hypothetical protein L596_008500 [Steinernema carpocapsae]